MGVRCGAAAAAPSAAPGECPSSPSISSKALGTQPRTCVAARASAAAHIRCGVARGPAPPRGGRRRGPWAAAAAAAEACCRHPMPHLHARPRPHLRALTSAPCSGARPLPCCASLRAAVRLAKLAVITLFSPPGPCRRAAVSLPAPAATRSTAWLSRAPSGRGLGHVCVRWMGSRQPLTHPAPPGAPGPLCLAVTQR